MISIYEPNTDYRHDRKSYLIQWDIKRAYYISQIKDVKHSPNIIDLIEVGDYVNGILVTGKEGTLLYTEIKGIDGSGYHIPISQYGDNIENIVTKECFASVSYEV